MNNSPNDQTAVPSNAGDFASAVHDYINQSIQFADQKAAFLFTAVAAMLAFLHQKGITTEWTADPWTFQHILAFVAVVGLTIGAAIAVWVVRPRIGGDRAGLVFWKSIAKIDSAEAYARQVLAPNADLTDAMLKHCHELAKNCKWKYLRVDIAVAFGGVGLLASILHLALFTN